jgi:hypothetical protein
MKKPWKVFWSEIILDDIVLILNVSTFEGQKIGELVPITTKSLSQDYIISSLTEWRKKYRKFFFTEFRPNNNRTRDWLKNTVLSNESQMLFLIYSDNSLIGHYGFKDLTDNSVLMDNLIRGVSGGHQKLIERSIMSLISWLFINLDIESVRGSILSDNPFAMIVNKAIGFEYSGLEKNPLPDGRYSRDIILTRTSWEKKSKVWWENF